MQITIKNWHEYNPRNDYKTIPWFRCEADIAFSQKLFGLKPQQKWFWIFLLSMAGKENNPEFQLDICYASQFSGLPKSDIITTIKYLEQNQLIAVTRSGDDRGTIVSRSLRNDTNVTIRTNERISATELREYASEFLDCWKEYPRKKGKHEAYKAWKKIPESKREFVLAACVSYFKEVQFKGTRPEYIKHMSSFLNSGRWEDYHDLEIQNSIVAEVANKTKTHWDIQREKIESGEI